MRESNSNTEENKNLTFFEFLKEIKQFLEYIIYEFLSLPKGKDKLKRPLALPEKRDTLESVEPKKTHEVLVVNTRGNPYREPVHTELFKQDLKISIPLFVEDEKESAETVANKLVFDTQKNYNTVIGYKDGYNLTANPNTATGINYIPRKRPKATIGKLVLTTYFTCPTCQGRVFKKEEHTWVCSGKCKAKGCIGEFSKKSIHALQFYNEFIIHEKDES
ncbi:MAG TPA: hypothetical protein VMX17_06155 [Candidatus Glassbacteria bacterium]|nr:hypothetical protein [Candidatus Glassbacteria bacterium]